MHVNAVIAEYNPFHNGHAYHLAESRRLTGADYQIVALSGNFTQRGAPALFDKRLRAQMALAGGADLVLELPLCHACGSAPYFAGGAVSLLEQLGVVDTLCFGAERGETQDYLALAAVLEEEPARYRELLRGALRGGHSYPRARSLALSALPGLSEEQKALLSSPNSLLGTEYCRALRRRGSAIRPVALRRTGSAYAEETLPGAQEAPSALALRRLLEREPRPEAAEAFLPPPVFALLQSGWRSAGPVWEDDLSGLLFYRLTLLEQEGYEAFTDVSEALSDRIRRRLPEYRSFSQFCGLLKTREVTYTRLSRCLLHILLDMRKERQAAQDARGDVPYARVLGFRSSAAPLLHTVRRQSAVPLLTRLPDARRLLGREALAMLEEDVRAAHLYRGVLAGLYRVPVQNEYRLPPVIV